MPFVAAQQFELISDDPRCEDSLVSELREFWKATREMHGVLTQTQAARILGVSAGQVGVWMQRGRLTVRVVAGARMVGGAEVAALLRERQSEIRASGGRGIKAPSLAELSAAAWQDLKMDEI